jgi:hypothetical protein
MTTNEWHHVQTFDEYCDFTKELYSIPDDGNTSVDMRMIFNTETRTCNYWISLHNDTFPAIDWKKAHYISWAAGLQMLGDTIDIPKELT